MSDRIAANVMDRAFGLYRAALLDSQEPAHVAIEKVIAILRAEFSAAELAAGLDLMARFRDYFERADERHQGRDPFWGSAITELDTAAGLMTAAAHGRFALH